MHANRIYLFLIRAGHAPAEQLPGRCRDITILEALPPQSFSRPQEIMHGLELPRIGSARPAVRTR